MELLNIKRLIQYSPVLLFNSIHFLGEQKYIVCMSTIHSGGFSLTEQLNDKPILLPLYEM